MSAPDTNLNKQKRRHIVPLVGMGVIAVIFVFLILVYWPAEEAVESDGPQGAATQIDGRTGEPTTTEPFTATSPEMQGDAIAPPPATSEPAPPVVDPAADPLVEDPLVPEGTTPPADGQPNAPAN
ncbi:hypothetical protein [Halodurantibacterium flavum]|uniref:Uncharacterized protein n=1 Tax=Halodurantibacterium flavum TaxID=1382802 RepID=A0ABW4SBC1_9RHOB